MDLINQDNLKKKKKEGDQLFLPHLFWQDTKKILHRDKALVCSAIAFIIKSSLHSPCNRGCSALCTTRVITKMQRDCNIWFLVFTFKFYGGFFFVISKITGLGFPPIPLTGSSRLMLLLWDTKHRWEIPAQTQNRTNTWPALAWDARSACGTLQVSCSGSWRWLREGLLQSPSVWRSPSPQLSRGGISYQTQSTMCRKA